METTTLVEQGNAFTHLAGAQPPPDLDAPRDEPYDAIVIGAGQAGLSVGYHLQRKGLRFAILEGNARIGDTWRRRWDSLRLFTPAKFDSLDGLPFPAPPNSFPTKDEMADYLEQYAEHFDLPVQTGVRVERVWRRDGRYVVTTKDGRDLEADQVVVAMANYQRPKRPAFAAELSRDIVQLHSFDYRNPSQLAPGDVLIVGAGNSGAEIAMELSRSRKVWMSGRDVGEIPFRIGGFLGRLLLVRLVIKVIFHRILTIRTPFGRKVYPKFTSQGGPRIRTKTKDLATAGVETVPRTEAIDGGLPRLADGRVLDVKNIVWCTGFHPAFTWIDLPIFEDNGKPRHDGGVVAEAPGLYFVGLHFLYAASSAMIHGVGRDAKRIVEHMASVTAAKRSHADRVTAATQ